MDSSRRQLSGESVFTNRAWKCGHLSSLLVDRADWLSQGRQAKFINRLLGEFPGLSPGCHLAVSGHSTHSKSKMILNLCICKDLFSNEVNFAGSRDTSLGVTPIQSMTKGKADEHLNKGKGRRRGNYTELLLKPARIHGAKWGGELFSLIMVTRAVEYWMGIQHGCTREEGCPPLRLPLRGHHIVATAE